MKLFRQELESVYDQFGQQLFVCALAVTGNGDLAEDAVHDAFCRALNKPRDPGNSKAYMFKSVRNAAIDIVRKTNRIRQWTIETVERPYNNNGCRDPEKEEMFTLVLEAMMLLKETQREVVMAHLVAGMTFREIAEVKRKPQGTVAADYRRGLIRLKILLEKYNGSV